LPGRYIGIDEYRFDRPGKERMTIEVVIEHVTTSRIPARRHLPRAPDAGAEPAPSGSKQFNTEKGD
jgi:hypothetical protein